MTDTREHLSQEGFSRKEVDAILQRAAALQLETEASGAWLKRDELEAGAEAAGISEACLAQAIQEVKAEREWQSAQRAWRRRMLKLGAVTAMVVVLFWVTTAHYILNNRFAAVEATQAQFENVLQRRHDLIPNLIRVARASTAHEQELIASITAVHHQLSQTTTFAERQRMAQQLEAFMHQLMETLRVHPDASSTALFLRLSDEMSGSENRVAVERKRYNDAVTRYNRAVRGLFVGMMRWLLGFPAHLPAFQAAPEARKPIAF